MTLVVGVVIIKYRLTVSTVYKNKPYEEYRLLEDV